MKTLHSILMTLAAASISGLLGGCSTVPENIRLEPEPTLDIKTVTASPEAHKGETVRWGGVIVSTENTKTDSRIELVAYPLTGSARPRISSTSPGRFIAVINGFVDPLVYTKGREVTVVGVIKDPIDADIGQYTYHYPVVQVSAYTLWPVRAKETDRIIDPFWVYPWYPYPYYYPYHTRYWHPPVQKNKQTQ